MSIKILYVITQPGGGGAQKYVLTLAKRFKGAIAAGTEAQKLSNDAKNLPASPAGGQLITYNLQHLKRGIHPWHDLLAIFEIRDLIKKLRPDIVHLNSTKAGILGTFAAIGLKTKIIFTAHGFVFNESLPFWLKNFYLALEKIASDFRSMIIAVSEADRQSALSHNLIAPDKITVVHNGLGVINFLLSDEAKKILNLPKDKFVFGTIANFYKTKGLDVLIEAALMLPDEIQNKCLFAIIGEGPEKAKLKTEGDELKAKIKFLGKVENAAKYLTAFDAFILPSRKEGFPYTVLEAMRAGVPIISTSVGGIPEALADAGILVPPGDPKALAEAITRMFFNEPLRKNLSKKALERSTLFTEEKMLSETEKIYKKITLK